MRSRLTPKSLMPSLEAEPTSYVNHAGLLVEQDLDAVDQSMVLEANSAYR